MRMIFKTLSTSREKYTNSFWKSRGKIDGDRELYQRNEAKHRRDERRDKLLRSGEKSVR